MKSCDDMDKLKTSVISLGIAVSFLTGYISGFCGGLAQPCEDCETYKKTIEEMKEVESYGENGNKVYTVEIWEDGLAKVITYQQYLHQEGNTLIIKEAS